MIAEASKKDSADGSPSSSTVCLNCGWQIERNYCTNCGQHKANHNAGVWQFIAEFLEEFVRFDSKLLRTVVPLVTKPGFLTRQWAEGKRVRYISPLKLYITISALCFIVVSLRTTSSSSHTLGSQANLAGSSSVAQLSWLDSILNRGVPSMLKVDPRVLREHFFMHLPTASLLLIPVAALVLCLFYLRPKRYYVEHLVFMLHYNSFCFLTYGVALLTYQDAFRLVAILWATGYLLAAIRNNYREGWLKSILKFCAFTSIYFVLVVSAMVGTVVVSAYMASALSMGSTMPSQMHEHSH